MIPLRSSERTYSKPVVIAWLVALNVVIFLYEWAIDPSIAETYGIVPYRFQFRTLITSMFLHGSWLHLIGNMWFLWIFGKAIEDLLNHGRFLLFYLLCGVVAGYIQVATQPYSPVPTVGASGAIAGVMGGYLVKFPRARITTLVPIIIFITTVDLPAAFLLLYWFVIQFFSGLGSLSHVSLGGGIAWFAHVGGFVAGMILISLMPTRPRFRYYYQ